MDSFASFGKVFRSITLEKSNSIHADRVLHVRVNGLVHLAHGRDGTGDHVDEVATSIISKTIIYYPC